MAIAQLKSGFWVTVGVIGAFVILGFILGAFGGK
jgi:hypothetical protein